MDNPLDTFNTRYVQLVEEASGYDLPTEESTTAMKNLETFSKCRPPTPEPEPIPDPVPTTRWGKVKAGASNVWDNETTRVFIKAGGAFAGVGLVVFSTIRRDQVLDRQALSQATQRND